MQIRQAMLVTPSRCNTGCQDREPFGDEAIDDLQQRRTVLLVLSPPDGQR